MSEFDLTFATRTAFPLAVRAYTISGFPEDCGDLQLDGETTPVRSAAPLLIQVDPATCKQVWSQASPAARGMLENVMADGLIFGLLAALSDSIIIAFRGTRTTSDILKDIQIHPGPGKFGIGQDAPDIPGNVHEGFQSIYRTVRLSIEQSLRRLLASNPNLSISIIGHSLGAALGLLCSVDPIVTSAARAPVRTYTFAGPRVGDDTFAEAFDATVGECFRIVNMFDVVPNLPLREPGSYRHVGKAVVIDGFKLSLNPLVDEHVLCGGYKRGLIRTISVGSPRAVDQP